MPLIRIKDIDQHYEIAGIGDSNVPFVFIAGMGGAASYWSAQVPFFESKFKVLTYDQRGTGKSSRVKVLSIDQLADDLICMLDQLNLKKVHLVGHSTGAAIGLIVASRNPEYVKSLVSYAGIHRADPYRERVWGLRKKILQEMGPEIYAQTTSLFFYEPEYINLNHQSLVNNEINVARNELASADIMASRIDAILKLDIAGDLSKINCPTLVMCAEDDLLTPAYFSREIAELIPNSRLKLISKGGHAFSRSHANEFNLLINEFIESCDG